MELRKLSKIKEVQTGQNKTGNGLFLKGKGGTKS